MLVIFTYIMGLLMAFEPITDNDYFWHIVIGKWVDINKAIPSKELFSWFGTLKDYDWTSHEWLTEWIMYKAGHIGCIILMLIIFIGLYILMTKMLKINLKKWLDFRLLYLLLMTVFFKVTGPRPYIISLLFFAYFVYILFNYLDKNKPIFNKLIWTIPIVQILWANLHGGSSSLPYVFIIGILLCDFVLKLFKNKEQRWGSYLLDKKQIKTLLILLGTILLTTCINPTGINLLLYPFTNMADSSMIDTILEWKSPSFHGLLGIYIFIIIAVPIATSILYHKKIKFYEIALLGLMLFMCLRSQRFIGMYGIYSTWIVGKYFFFTDSMYERLKKPFIKFQKYIQTLVIILIIVIISITAKVQFNNFNKVYDNHGYYSDEIINKLIELKPERMYNDFGAGGYLLFKLSERDLEQEIKLFIYGLGDVFSTNILPDSNNLFYLKTDPKEMINKYNFDVILTIKNSPLRQFLFYSDEWNIYYYDDTAYIFIKR